MRVGIDALALDSHAGGDTTYIRNVIRGLAAVDPNSDYTLFSTSAPSERILVGIEHMRRVAVWCPSLALYTPVSLPIAFLRKGIDVAHVQYVASPLCPAQVVVSVHDIAYEHYPHFFTPTTVTKFRMLVPLTVRRAAAILTLSEYSKRDIVRRYCVPSEKVTVAPCAADPMYRPMRDEERDTGRLAEIRAKYGTGERFILSVGNLQPRKNLRTLIEAYVKLRQADATRHKLVLVGREAWLHDDIFAAARASGYADELVFTGYVPDADLVALYNAADVFVYPSLFEGFGLPPLEAMACGTPTVTGNTSALPETVGEAALMVDPRDAEALAGALARVLGDAELRAELAGRGIARAAAFSWERTARIILDTYRRAAQPERW